MKKIIYGILIFCLMFVGINNANALGGINLDTQYIEVEQGKSATFKIVVDNALARANITVGNKKMLSIDGGSSWLSEAAGKGEKVEHVITINSVGKAGTTNVLVDIFDATTYDREVLATSENRIKYVVTVKVLPTTGGNNIILYVVGGIILILAIGGYIFYRKKKNSKAK